MVVLQAVTVRGKAKEFYDTEDNLSLAGQIGVV